MQNRNRLTEFENKLTVTKAGGGIHQELRVEGYIRSLGWRDTQELRVEGYIRSLRLICTCCCIEGR